MWHCTVQYIYVWQMRQLESMRDAICTLSCTLMTSIPYSCACMYVRTHTCTYVHTHTHMYTEAAYMCSVKECDKLCLTWDHSSKSSWQYLCTSKAIQLWDTLSVYGHNRFITCSHIKLSSLYGYTHTHTHTHAYVRTYIASLHTTVNLRADTHTLTHTHAHSPALVVGKRGGGSTWLKKKKMACDCKYVQLNRK